MAKSKITQATATGTIKWQDKTLSKFFLNMENGESGTYTIGFGADDKTPMIGDELDYEVVDKGYGNEIKPNRTGGAGGGGGFKKWTPEQIAEQNAIKITVAAIEAGHLKTWKAIYTASYEFFLKPEPAEVKSFVDKAQATIAAGMPAKPGQSIQNTPIDETSDDLPF